MIIGDYFIDIWHEHKEAKRAKTRARVYDLEQFRSAQTSAQAQGKTAREVLETITPIAESTAICGRTDVFSKRRGILIAGGRAFKQLGFYFWFKSGKGETPGQYLITKRDEVSTEQKEAVTA